MRARVIIGDAALVRAWVLTKIVMQVLKVSCFISLSAVHMNYILSNLKISNNKKALCASRTLLTTTFARALTQALTYSGLTAREGRGGGARMVKLVDVSELVSWVSPSPVRMAEAGVVEIGTDDCTRLAGTDGGGS